MRLLLGRARGHFGRSLGLAVGVVLTLPEGEASRLLRVLAPIFSAVFRRREVPPLLQSLRRVPLEACPQVLNERHRRRPSEVDDLALLQGVAAPVGRVVEVVAEIAAEVTCVTAEVRAGHVLLGPRPLLLARTTEKGM